MAELAGFPRQRVSRARTIAARSIAPVAATVVRVDRSRSIVATLSGRKDLAAAALVVDRSRSIRALPGDQLAIAKLPVLRPRTIALAGTLGGTIGVAHSQDDSPFHHLDRDHNGTLPVARVTNAVDDRGDDMTGRLGITVSDAFNNAISDALILSHAMAPAGFSPDTGGALATGLISYWPMSEASGAAVDVVAGNDAAVDAGATTQVAGKLGNARNFDGADYLLAPDHPSLRPAGALTLAVWARAASSAHSTVVTKRYATTADPQNSYTIGITGPGGGTWECVLSNGTPGSQVIVVGPSVVIGAWVHLAMTYDGARLRFYANGVEAGSIAKTGAVGYSTMGLYIGETPNGTGANRFNGDIDDIGLWNRALTAAEITDLYNGGAGNAYNPAANATDGMGAGLLLRVQDPAGTIENAARIAALMTTNQDGSETSALVVQARNAGGALTEYGRFAPTGLTLSTPLAVASGGTGAATAAGALSNLGVGVEDSPQFTGLTIVQTNAPSVANTAESFKVTLTDGTALNNDLLGSQVYVEATAGGGKYAAGLTYQVTGNNLGSGNNTLKGVYGSAAIQGGSIAGGQSVYGADVLAALTSTQTSGASVVYGGKFRVVAAAPTGGTLETYALHFEGTGNGTTNYGLFQSGAQANYLAGALTIAPTSNQIVLGTTRTLTLTAPTPATSSRTLTLPDPGGNDSVVYLALAQTLSNKTFSTTVTVPDGSAAAPGLRVTTEATGLYRASSTSLGFSVAGASYATLNTSGQWALPTTGSGAGVLIGGDTQIYRSAADVLRTPDSLTVDGALTVSGGAAVTGVLSYTGGSLKEGGDVVLDSIGVVLRLGSSGVWAEIRVGSTHVAGIVSLHGGGTERARIDANGNLIVGTAALATTATDGFLYIPTCAGTPTGTPSSYAGRVAMVFDSTNNRLYIYDGGWISAAFA